MRLAQPLAIALLSLVLLPDAQAARTTNIRVRTTGELAELCAANPNQPLGDAMVNFCHGFAQGVVDMALHGANRPFCFPSPPPTRNATLADFVGWVRAEPARSREPAAEGLTQFLAQRYACNK